MTADDRYRPEQQVGGTSSNGRALPGLWAIRDTKTGALVRTPGENGEPELVTFPLRDLATAWIRRETYLQEAGYGRA
ncbi:MULTISPECIES: hypothetical protein [unclassified Kitasatospora]|uniref:hypothetical protein n=1 Tax=unclassified Kitasatospora TaxID=2633591 RepID=UPI00070C1213|nr:MULTISPECIES: hypothetical protein [unclassified Kitasatospora]KQV05627.1 hypothetical protein ASC99_12550 [Kitasatospora sp. Root107]KRB62431.1 hypothetical protein ASE03_07505 [Kitasatospora sp. Root187]